MFDVAGSYIARPSGLGVGTSNLAYQRSIPLSDPSLYVPRYVVDGGLTTVAPAFVKDRQQVVDVGLLGNGAGFAGIMALQQLAAFERQGKPK